MRNSEGVGCLIFGGIFLFFILSSTIKENPIVLVYILCIVVIIYFIYYSLNYILEKTRNYKISADKIQILNDRISGLTNENERIISEKKQIEYELKIQLSKQLAELENKIFEVSIVCDRLKNESIFKKSMNLFFEEEFNEVNNKRLKINDLYKDLKIKVESKDEFIKNLILQLQQKDISIASFLNKDLNNDFFNKISQTNSDYILSEFTETEEFLKTKKHPAIKKASDIKILRIKSKEILIKYNLLKYKYELIFSLFPELENYFDNLSDILDSKFESIDEFKDNYDYARDYLTDAEYKNLTETERNQMALDRYIEKHKKSDWQIGRDYEIMVGQLFEKEGFKIEYFGTEKKLNDLGRDLIAHKNDTTLIIQCKRWSEKKVIREKHITQIYGTTIMYGFENNYTDRNKIIKPVLVSTTELSETAKEFANKLGVSVQKIKFQEFPRIKCNINSKGERIYHLPFDQQYDRTKINKKDESYELTVQEAEDKGFRRAMRFYSNS